MPPKEAYMKRCCPGCVWWEVDTHRCPDQAGFSVTPNLRPQQWQPGSWFLQETVARGWSDSPPVSQGEVCPVSLLL